MLIEPPNGEVRFFILYFEFKKDSSTNWHFIKVQFVKTLLWYSFFPIELLSTVMVASVSEVVLSFTIALPQLLFLQNDNSFVRNRLQ